MDFGDRLNALDDERKRWDLALSEAAQHQEAASHQIAQILRQSADYLLHHQVEPLPVLINATDPRWQRSTHSRTGDFAWASPHLRWALTRDAMLLPVKAEAVPVLLTDMLSSPFRGTGLVRGARFGEVVG
jgi:hypothetical protein